ncbi:hypothetical protein NUU61_002405 [Penicillium alfredii]|uniref:Uncharacterized protein n=1 Tax=Penicillium alfredii TaxID=1506179 RepID=A0A9W9KGU8_9EURO|nr:uncharacterized protein NUU61_002405 [Penicillium alfredii]KAJ5105058.1 hypothetical protein NUU61_002405 [Penicillium alfredii]
MPSTGHQGPFANSMPKDQAVLLPAARNLTSSNDPSQSVALNRDNSSSEQTWIPTPNRRQSWSSQDHKHQLQDRLLDVEKGSETGFTETDSEKAEVGREE